MANLFSRKTSTCLLYSLSAVILVSAVQMSKAEANSVTFSATGTNTYAANNNPLSAFAVFDDSLGQNKLKLTLTNTKAASDPSDILTAVFWDYAGSPLSLSLSSATAATVTKYVTTGNGNNAQTTLNTTSNVNLLDVSSASGLQQEWAFASTTTATGLGGDVRKTGSKAVTEHYGLGTAGLGIFQNIGGSQQFKYGITNGYNSNANSPIQSSPLVNNSASFVLSGLNADFDVTKISNIRFQYGTALNETSTYYVAPVPPKKIPESRTIVALGLFVMGVLKLLKKKSLLGA